MKISLNILLILALNIFSFRVEAINKTRINRCDSVCSNSNLACSSNVECVLTSCSDNGFCYQFCLNCKGITLYN